MINPNNLLCGRIFLLRFLLFYRFLFFCWIFLLSLLLFYMVLFRFRLLFFMALVLFRFLFLLRGLCGIVGAMKFLATGRTESWLGPEVELEIYILNIVSSIL